VGLPHTSLGSSAVSMRTRSRPVALRTGLAAGVPFFEL